MTDRPATDTSEHVVRQLLEATQEGFWHIDVDGLTIDVNPAMCGILGRAREDVLGRSIFDFVDAENRKIFDQQLALRKQGITGPYEIELQRPDGTNIPCINNATPVLDEHGVRISSIGLWTEITELKRRQASLERTTEAAERAADDARQLRASLEAQVQERTAELQRLNIELRSSQNRYRQLTELSPNALFVNAQGTMAFANPAMVRLMGANTADQIIGKPADEFTSPIARQRLRDARDRFEAGERRIDFEDIPLRRLDGKDVDVTATAILTTWDGEDAYLIIARDITDRKQLEEQLRQSQRLEAVGQLTGGIAHDFNNLLAVIQGNIEFLEDEIGTGNQMLQSIARASKRGAELTQRLLAFSRRQQLQPRSLDLSSLVDDLYLLLDRTLGAKVDVRVSFSEDLWPAMVDPGQLENVILNLVINARDAMPDGGTVMIECRNAVIDESEAQLHPDASAGEYVVLSVRDTGLGMPDDVMARAFEPFFTTKEFGKGSGLGLSMVYGFVRQSNGHVTIRSEPGVETVITLYFPRAKSAIEGTVTAPDSVAPEGRGEHILVVEDDDDVRTLVVQTLDDLGYRVSDVSLAEDGLSRLEDDTFDLILSDVVLPGEMTGPELVDRARTLFPGIGVLLMSGYPADAAQNSDHPLLRKPFQRTQLANAVHEAVSTLKTSKRATG